LGTLAFLLGTTREDLENQLEEAERRGARPYDPVPVAEGVDLRTITLIEENQARLGSSVLITNDIKRLYPQGQLAAHVLGYTGIVTDEDLERAEADDSARQLKFDDIIGKSGLEREYDALLAGKRGSEEWEVDARNRPVRPRGRIREIPGATLHLTLDAKLQKAAEDALAKARNNGAIAAIDPRNGEVLALASRPTFNPNIWSLPRKQFQREYLKLVNSQGHPLLNRPVVSRFPPGSTFKMVSAAAGLQKGAVTPNWTVTCNGGLRMGRWFGCWHTHGAGVDLFDAFAGSCDVYFYQLALRLGDPESTGPTYLASVARRFGLGSPTGIDLPSDAKGLIPDPEWRKRINKRHPDLAHWYPGNTLNMSIGQGDVLATPLQMARVTAAVANNGTLWTPHLLHDAQLPNGKTVVNQPKGQNVGIDPRYLAMIRQGMREVVTRGTGRGCAMPNVDIAGKTGSAEDVHNALPHAWWVCFAPYQNPTIAIAVMVENSGHGSENAAPIAKAVLEAAFPAKPAAKPGEKN
jgi:penicillin-binding protein 2